ncbi:TPA: RICIN domain-containing protein [Campylobacter jejuni]|uniref:Cytolethal distending toxin subunit A n=1 Tax=Campylobacter jejuni TaxID=197 RepID=A0A5T0PYP8_CAMJU|nr:MULTISPECIES: RICIN domain-containing protein [Campylobacter]EAH9620694.1 cytolethal distending toxin subunit A [Campylobacter jejuni]EAH9620823.1 cytolethal distending toxin subunit A [Campylobacter jejuni]EAH9620830.1 cytolethal distending toxin subunit A [Campylobacter jejuni]EAI4882093.1 cytolethal distending toxin subunit A [Campylobacter jejuni]EAI7226663.1 cytolethal distending toxin subunit A [Campylobacter jejuni]
MQKINLVIILSLLLLFFIGCSPKELNPLGRSYGKLYDSDPLKIGKKPTIPAKQEIPALIDDTNLIPADIPLEPPLIKLNTFKDNSSSIKGPLPRLKSNGEFNDASVYENRGYPSDFVTIMGPSGAALTVWALRPGNWIWGYNLYSSIPFGDANIWQLIEFPNNKVMIKNAKTLTCLNAYGEGIVHYPCDQSNYAQFWKLYPMSNGAYQIQNFATQKCIQTPIQDVMHEFNFSFYDIYTTDCLKSGEKNLDRQWYITAPTFASHRPYR